MIKFHSFHATQVLRTKETNFNTKLFAISLLKQFRTVISVKLVKLYELFTGYNVLRQGGG